MTLLAVLGKSGHIASIEDFSTPGLASQKARCYTEAGTTCRVIPDELREDVEYLMGQLQEKREDGFIREYGIIPNGTRTKGEGARGIGRMIFPAFGGMLEGDRLSESSPLASRQSPPPLSSDDLIIPRKN